ncbi:bromodomain associated family protein [Musa troglodytarum]|uniref:Transcription initiation factor TFIID subunit 8 n=1 Tax=Musa troglodytarum TaxID=320322 RepID=A0A9E7HSU0_9LILI|nr:bromodomain associated family protein [Musa troglodytarum]
MNDGGKESESDQQSSLKKSLPSSATDEFGRAVVKIAVAQICETVGFQGSHYSAVDALTEVTVRYICDLGKSASFYAHLAGRTSCNVFDIIQSLEDLSSQAGFSGASDVHHCLVGSGVVREITHFVSTKEEVPFAQPIPKFPVPRVPKATPSFAQVNKEPPGKHIPDWLPRLPDPHTYVHTPVWNKRTTDAKTDKVEQARQRRKAERSLLSLQKRLASSEAAGFQPTGDGDVGKGKQVVGSNPFLAPPLPYKEKAVSENARLHEADAGKRLSVLETFAPVFEAAKVGSLDLSASEKKVVLRSRPTVHFKIGIDKKSIAASLSSNALDAKKDSWPLRDDEKDDKKRRAEMILREAMEKPHDLAQLCDAFYCFLCFGTVNGAQLGSALFRVYQTLSPV